eukprot:366402-Chlamydomonas_euryale.AAC.13
MRVIACTTAKAATAKPFFYNSSPFSRYSLPGQMLPLGATTEPSGVVSAIDMRLICAIGEEGGGEGDVHLKPRCGRLMRAHGSSCGLSSQISGIRASRGKNKLKVHRHSRTRDNSALRCKPGPRLLSNKQPTPQGTHGSATGAWWFPYARVGCARHPRFWYTNVNSSGLACTAYGIEHSTAARAAATAAATVLRGSPP